jgi:hypothetical protein
MIRAREGPVKPGKRSNPLKTNVKNALLTHHKGLVSMGF